MSRLASAAFTVQEEGSRLGERKSPSRLLTRTLSILPPRSAREVTTMFRALKTMPSIPVTSMNRSSVSSVTDVSSPLMMGGKEST